MVVFRDYPAKNQEASERDRARTTAFYSEQETENVSTDAGVRQKVKPLWV
jgi:hypothetical protein